MKFDLSDEDYNLIYMVVADYYMKLVDAGNHEAQKYYSALINKLKKQRSLYGS